MDEPLYPPLTANQRKILQAAKCATRVSRQQIAGLLGVDQREADPEILSLIIRAALVADAADHDIFSLGEEASFWMSPQAVKGVCGKTCPSCGVNPCAKQAGHGGMCYCSDCRYGD